MQLSGIAPAWRVRCCEFDSHQSPTKSPRLTSKLRSSCLSLHSCRGYRHMPPCPAIIVFKICACSVTELYPSQRGHLWNGWSLQKALWIAAGRWQFLIPSLGAECAGDITSSNGIFIYVPPIFLSVCFIQLNYVILPLFYFVNLRKSNSYDST